MAAKSGRTRGAKSVPDDIAHEDGNEPRARAFWSGTITFGLVSIPVELFPAHRSLRVPLRMVDEEGTPLVRRYVCPKDGKHLDRHEIVRGFPVEKDEYVVLTDEELERLAPERTRDIDLRQFVPVAQLDPLYFERGYYLTPGGRSTKAYRLLAGTMEETGRAGIATFVMRGKEYLVAITADSNVLRADTLRFSDELRSAADVGLPKKRPAVKKPDLARMKKAISSHATARVAEAELEDEYAEKLHKLVARKERKDEDVYELPEEAADEERGEADVIDLVAVLKRSLRGGAAPARKGARKAPPRKAAAPRRSGRAASGPLRSRAKASGAPARTRKAASK